MRIHLMAACLALLSVAVPARAQAVNELYGLMRLDSLIAIMRDEGLDYGRTLGEDMLGGSAGAGWDATVGTIYDEGRMRAVVQDAFTRALSDTDVAPLVDFFSGETGQEVIALELAAREALVDDAVEEAARERYREVAEEGGNERLETLERFASANDLVEANVAGALNASLRFYSGLVDGGAFAMSERDILREVWSTEEETRADTREWVFAFLMLAYQPLEREALLDYVALSETPEGRALNGALFAAFNEMYDTISYALGLAAARQMQAQEL